VQGTSRFIAEEDACKFCQIPNTSWKTSITFHHTFQRRSISFFSDCASKSSSSCQFYDFWHFLYLFVDGKHYMMQSYGIWFLLTWVRSSISSLIKLDIWKVYTNSIYIPKSLRIFLT
jgi:hypothetical protein